MQTPEDHNTPAKNFLCHNVSRVKTLSHTTHSEQEIIFIPTLPGARITEVKPQLPLPTDVPHPGEDKMNMLSLLTLYR